MTPKAWADLREFVQAGGSADVALPQLVGMFEIERAKLATSLMKLDANSANFANRYTQIQSALETYDEFLGRLRDLTYKEN